jgi:exodeoxyribonuclease VII small subunit
MNAERRDDQASPDDEPVEDLSYMAASRELDGIVEFFEKSEVDVDQLVARLERATAIVDELDKRIRRTRAQVEELVPKLEAAGRAAVTPQTTAGADAAPSEGDEVHGQATVELRTEDTQSDRDSLPF